MAGNYSNAQYESMERSELIAQILYLQAALDARQADNDKILQYVSTTVSQLSEKLSLLDSLSEQLKESAQLTAELSQYQSLGTPAAIAAKLDSLASFLQEFDSIVQARDAKTRLLSYEGIGSIAECQGYKSRVDELEQSSNPIRDAALTQLRNRFTTSAGGIPSGLISFANGRVSGAFNWTVPHYSIVQSTGATQGRLLQDFDDWFEPATALQMAVQLPAACPSGLLAIRATLRVRTATSATVSTIGIGRFCRERGGHIYGSCLATQRAGDLGTEYGAYQWNVVFPREWGAAAAGHPVLTSWVVSDDVMLVAYVTQSTVINKPLALPIVIAAKDYGIVGARIHGLAIDPTGDPCRTSAGAIEIGYQTGAMVNKGVLGEKSNTWMLAHDGLGIASRLTASGSQQELQELIDRL